MNATSKALPQLLETIKTLRGTSGCPWDRKQTPVSLQKYLKEEISELLQAIDNNDPENICEEIGDVIYVLAMIAETFNEQALFTLDDCISGIDKKLIRRHPHVFGDAVVNDEKQLRNQWETIKKEEKKRNN